MSHGHIRTVPHRLIGWQLAVLALLVGACGPGDGQATRTPERSPAPRDEGPTPTAMPDPEPTPEATAEPDLGPAMTMDELSPMSDEGVAVQVDDDVVLVGLDGTVHGHIPDTDLHVPGADLETIRGLQHVPGGFVALRGNEHGSGWIDQAAGVFWPDHQGTPLLGASAQLDPHAGTPDAWVIHRPEEPVARWHRDDRWWLSAGHRVVTWEECPDDAEVGAPCPTSGYDLASDTALDLEPGCWVADARGEGDHLRVCHQPEAEPPSWLELDSLGADQARYELPRPDDAPAPGHFLSAELGDGWILAQASMECEVRSAALLDIDSGDLQPVLGEDEPLMTPSLALGWLEDGRAAVLVHDSPCAEPDQPSGVWLVDPAGDDHELIYPLPADTGTEAHLWRPVEDVELQAP